MKINKRIIDRLPSYFTIIFFIGALLYPSNLLAVRSIIIIPANFNTQAVLPLNPGQDFSLRESADKSPAPLFWGTEKVKKAVFEGLEKYFSGNCGRKLYSAALNFFGSGEPFYFYVNNPSGIKAILASA